MKKLKIAYWIFTILMIALMGFSAISSFMTPTAQGTAMMQHIGYPYNILTFLGVAKILAIIVILIPGYPRLKEWAYAGLTFDLIGAIYAGQMAGDPLMLWFIVILGLVFVLGSYFLYHRIHSANG